MWQKSPDNFPHISLQDKRAFWNWDYKHHYCSTLKSIHLNYSYRCQELRQTILIVTNFIWSINISEPFFFQKNYCFCLRSLILIVLCGQEFPLPPLNKIYDQFHLHIILFILYSFLKKVSASEEPNSKLKNK